MQNRFLFDGHRSTNFFVSNGKRAIESPATNIFTQIIKGYHGRVRHSAQCQLIRTLQSNFLLPQFLGLRVLYHTLLSFDVHEKIAFCLFCRRCGSDLFKSYMSAPDWSQQFSLVSDGVALREVDIDTPPEPFRAWDVENLLADRTGNDLRRNILVETIPQELEKFEQAGFSRSVCANQNFQRTEHRQKISERPVALDLDRSELWRSTSLTHVCSFASLSMISSAQVTTASAR